MKLWIITLFKLAEIKALTYKCILLESVCVVNNDSLNKFQRNGMK